MYVSQNIFEKAVRETNSVYVHFILPGPQEGIKWPFKSIMVRNKRGLQSDTYKHPSWANICGVGKCGFLCCFPINLAALNSKVNNYHQNLLFSFHFIKDFTQISVKSAIILPLTSVCLIPPLIQIL